VLVYDRAGRDIISPLLNVAQLRRNGITLHMLVSRRKLQTIGPFRMLDFDLYCPFQLDSDREPIPDVPAIYFCRPTADNIQRIAKDCRCTTILRA
jgi:hypothetical protein